MTKKHFTALLASLLVSLVVCLHFVSVPELLGQDGWPWLAGLSLLLGLGSALLALFSYRDTRRQLKRFMASLEKTKESREEYRHLIQNSHDILFSMDWDLRVKTVNRAVTEHLGLSPKRLRGLSLLDIIFFVEDSLNQINRSIVLEKVDLLRQGKRKKVKFKVFFQTQPTGEMRPYLLELSLSRKESKRHDHARAVIYGRAQSESADTLLPAFVRERQSYSISNSLIEAEELSQIVTAHLRRYMDSETAEHLRVAVRELILNSIEHGNLSITYEEKTRALKEGTYLDLFRKRREDPRFHKRRVQVDFLLNRRIFLLHIRDEGSGFDYDTFLKSRVPELKASNSSHGRGLMLALSAFHELRFQKPGNELTASLYLDKAKGRPKDTPVK